MGSRMFAFRILKKIVLVAVGVLVIYKILYYTGLLTLLISLVNLAKRSGITTWLQSIF